MSSRVEYLITIDEKDQFCKNPNGFNSLLKTIDGLQIHKNEIRYMDLQLQYEIQHGEIQKDKQRFFHIKLTLADDSKLGEFEALLRHIRGVLSRAGGRPPQVLWDGITTNFSQRAYPLIHELENTMRKLITKFMLTNVGLGWTKEAIPKEVQESVRSKEGRNDQNYLYEVDFIQLSNFLFKEYSTTTPQALVATLKNTARVEDLDLEQLKRLIPQSNWERFFSKVVSCENDYLRIRWEKMYERRNQVAHNRPLTRSDFEEVQILHGEIYPKLTQAIDLLDQVQISDDERELVSESVVSTKNLGYTEFMGIWNEFQNQMHELAALLSKDTPQGSLVAIGKSNIRNHVNIAKEYKVLSAADRKHIQNLIRLRNYMVHEPSVVVPSDVLLHTGNEIKELSRRIQEAIVNIVKNGRPPLPPASTDEVEVDGFLSDLLEEASPSELR